MLLCIVDGLWDSMRGEIVGVPAGGRYTYVLVPVTRARSLSNTLLPGTPLLVRRVLLLVLAAWPKDVEDTEVWLHSQTVIDAAVAKAKAMNR